MWGKDGKFYPNDHDGMNDMWAANARWNQQERQNQLLREQNGLKEKELKMREREIRNQNNSSSGTSTGQLGVMMILEQFKNESNGKMTQSEALKLLDIKSSIILHLCWSILIIPCLYLGVLEVIINTVAYMIPNVIVNINWYDAPIGRPLIAVYILYIIYLILKYKAFHKKILEDCKKRK